MKYQRALEFFEDSQIPVCGWVLNGAEGATGCGCSTHMAVMATENMVMVTESTAMEKEKEGRKSNQSGERIGKKKHEERNLSNVSEKSAGWLLALVGTAALSWLLILLGIAIHLDSPTDFLPAEAGRKENGTYFYIYKFRTMRIDTPHDMPTHMLNNPDLFITRVGRFLRKTSLDELPQLFNILKGDMALVGPRPALWNQYDLLVEREQYGANSVRPGLTGWAQIHGRDELPIRQKAELDGYYVHHIQPKMDLECLWEQQEPYCAGWNSRRQTGKTADEGCKEVVKVGK